MWLPSRTAQPTGGLRVARAGRGTDREGTSLRRQVSYTIFFRFRPTFSCSWTPVSLIICPLCTKLCERSVMYPQIERWTCQVHLEWVPHGTVIPRPTDLKFGVVSITLLSEERGLRVLFPAIAALDHCLLNGPSDVFWLPRRPAACDGEII